MQIDPLYPLSATRGTVPSVVPFTIRENPSLLMLVEEMRKWIGTDLVPFINENIGELSDNWETQKDSLVSNWNALSNELVDKVNLVASQIGDRVELAEQYKIEAQLSKEAAEIFATTVKEFQDVAVGSLITDIESVVRVSLDQLFLSNTVEGREAIVESKEFSKSVSSLNGTIFAAAYGMASGEDCTDAIDRASQDAEMQEKSLTFPAGKFFYSGNGILKNSKNIGIHGADRGITEIVLGDGVTLIDRVSPPLTMRVDNMLIRGGVGFYKSSGTETYTSGHYRVIENVRFVEYSGTTIESRSFDEPWWTFKNCLFRGRDYLLTKGVRLLGYANGSSFDSCDFDRNRVSIELGNAQDVLINNCSFYRLSGEKTNATVDVWFRPTPGVANAHYGWKISKCKFGNENLSSNDKRIVFADDDSTGFPSIDNSSTGYVIGGVISNNNIGSKDGYTVPLIYSTTHNIRNIEVLDNFSHGGGDGYLIEWLSQPEQTTSTALIVDGWNANTEGVTRLKSKLSNYPSNILNLDRVGRIESNVNGFMGSGDPTGYRKLSKAFDSSNSNNVSVSNTEDSLGRPSNVFVPGKQLVFSAGTAGYYGWKTVALTVDMPVWVELDLISIDTIGRIELRLIGLTSNKIHWQAQVRLKNYWDRVRLLLSNTLFGEECRFEVRNIASDGGTLKISRPHIYHSREPMPSGEQSNNIQLAGSWNSPHLQLGAHHIWLDDLGKVRIKSSEPTAPNDGVVLGSQS